MTMGHLTLIAQITKLIENLACRWIEDLRTTALRLENNNMYYFHGYSI